MITGYTFDRAKVPPLEDSTIYHNLSYGQQFVLPNIGNMMAVTTNGLTCTISTGKALVCGRLIEIASPESVQIPANSTGYLCLTVDLSQTNTSSGTPGQAGYTAVINQVRAEFVTSLTQENILNGGILYNFPLGSVTSNAANVHFTPNANSYNHQPLAISNGGTGATSETQARINIGARKETTLYFNVNGTRSTIPLSDNSSNYDFLEITYRDGSAYYTKKIDHKRGANWALNTLYMSTEDRFAVFNGKKATINETSITFSDASYAAFSASTNIYRIEDNIVIYKVVGYKY